MANCIGIDFGTTKTMVSYFNPATGRVELIRLGRDRDSIPTTVHVDESGDCLFGEDADDQIETDPEGYVRAFKLHLGEKESVLLRSDETSEALTAKFLRHIKNECEQSVFHGEKVTSATITIPVSFAPARRASLRKAAEAAGFSSVSFMPEPEAAGTAFLRENPADKFSRALVLDWGGGTLDIAIISRDEDGSIHADRHCAEGRDDVGGEEMDRGLLDNLDDMWDRAFGSRLLSSEENVPKLLREAEKVKIGLSRKDAVPFRRGRDKIEVSKNQFRQIVEQLLQAAVDLVQSALAKNRAQGNPPPDSILLIGGTSQSPVVRETMETAFPKLRVLSWHHSHEAVALGASQAQTKLPVKRTESSEDVEVENALNLAEKLSRESEDLSNLGNKEANIIETAAQSGNPRAAGLLATIYHDGCKGHPKSIRSSFEWAKQAAEAGDATGQSWLALYYLGIEEDNPVRKNRSKALEWAERAYVRDKSLGIKALLVIVLSEFDIPNTARIKRIGNGILKEIGNKTPEQFVFDDRAAIGTVCLVLSNIAFRNGDSEKALALLKKGAVFGNTICVETLAEFETQQNKDDDSFTVTDEATRLFANLGAIDDRRNQTERNFMEEWCPGICSSDSWTQPLRSTESIESLAFATAKSYDNDPEALEKLLSVLRDFAACDGKPSAVEKRALSAIKAVFDDPNSFLSDEEGEEEDEDTIDDAPDEAFLSDENDEKEEEDNIDDAPDESGNVPNGSHESWGAGTGALVGAGIGSIIPGVGTLAGAGIGALVGGIKKLFSDN